MSCATIVAAAPAPWVDACYLRSEAVPVGEPTVRPPAGAQSFLGIRQRRARLFEVSLTVVGADASVCSVAGVVRLRSGADGDLLALPVRAEPGATGAGSGNSGAGISRNADPGTCLVFVQATTAGFELATSEPECRAQMLCGGKVQLQGQRFDLASRVDEAGVDPCFARPPARR